MSQKDPVKLAILDALQKEKSRRPLSWAQAVGLSILFFITLSEGFGYILFDGATTPWRSLIFIWSLFFCFSIKALSEPSPRLEVAAFWRKRTFAKLVLVSLLVLLLQCLICPHFLFVSTPIGSALSFLSALPALYMEIGGMTACLFLCGATVGLLGGGFGIWAVRKNLSFRNLKAWGLGLLIVLVLSAPLGFLPKTGHDEHFQYPIWFVGVVSAFVLWFVAGTLWREWQTKSTHQS